MNIKVLVVCWMLGFCTFAAQAEVAVIVHPTFPSATLSKADFTRLYLGRTNTFPSGTPANAIDMAPGAVREQMLRQLLEKTDAEVANIWSKLVFSGNAKSLPRVSDDKSMLERIASDPSAIGYVDAKSVTGAVKVLNVQ